MRVGSGTLHWKRTGAAPQAFRGAMKGASHQPRSAAAITPAATSLWRNPRRDGDQRSLISYPPYLVSPPALRGALEKDRRSFAVGQRTSAALHPDSRLQSPVSAAKQTSYMVAASSAWCHEE